MEKVELQIGVLESTIAKRVLAIAQRSIDCGGRFSIALSGGKSPRELLRSISETLNKLPEGVIDVVIVDERHVPHDDPNSNQKMITECFSELLGAHLDVALYFVDTTLSYSLSVEEYRERVDHLLDETQIDLCILGLGEDGHVASLFKLPDSVGMEDVSVVATPREDYNRISLSYRSILNAGEIFIFAPGESKREIISFVESAESELRYPAQLIISNHPKVTLYTST